MKKIKLTQGKYALVDDEDFDFLNQWKWRASGIFKNKLYAIRSQWNNKKKKQTTIYLHRLIMNAPKGMEVDHINGNRLDNRKYNLRVCTTSQNGMNRGPQSNNKSGCKGIYWDKVKKRWRARIKFKGKGIYVGYSKNKKEAARAYLQAAKKYFGEFAWLNLT